MLTEEVFDEWEIRFASELPLNETQAIHCRTLLDMFADAAYEKGKTEERERIIKMFSAFTLDTNSLLHARQFIYRQVDPEGKILQSLKESK